MQCNVTMYIPYEAQLGIFYEVIKVSLIHSVCTQNHEMATTMQKLISVDINT